MCFLLWETKFDKSLDSNELATFLQCNCILSHSFCVSLNLPFILFHWQICITFYTSVPTSLSEIMRSINPFEWRRFPIAYNTWTYSKIYHTQLWKSEFRITMARTPNITSLFMPLKYKNELKTKNRTVINGQTNSTDAKLGRCWIDHVEH